MSSSIHSVPSEMTLALERTPLIHAFVSFREAAAVLERSYGNLQTEVARLRREREEINIQLRQSLDENRRILKRLSCILEGLPCGVLVMEKDGCFSRINPEARRLFAMPVNEPTDSVPGWAQQLLDCTTVDDGDKIFRSKKAHWLSLRRAEIDEDGSSFTVFMVRDVTEAKALERMEEALRRRRALAEMSAVLAHEIRNPLGSMELFAGLLAECPLNKEARQWVRQIQAGLRILAATVNNVLQFHSQAQIELMPTNLGQLLDSVEQFLLPLVERSGVRLELDNRLDNIVVLGDRTRLSQALLNLVINAMHVMPDGGCLRIQGESDGTQATIALTDSGPGIVPEHLGKIFDAGFTTRAGSPGLGLAVCKAVIEQHGAAIFAASTLGHGTTFTLKFPLWRES